MSSSANEVILSAGLTRVSEMINKNSLAANKLIDNLGKEPYKETILQNKKNLDNADLNYIVQKKQLLLYKTTYDLLLSVKKNLSVHDRKAQVHFDIETKAQFKETIKVLADIYENHFSHFSEMLENTDSNNVMLYLYFLDITHYSQLFEKHKPMEHALISFQKGSFQSLLIFLSPLEKSEDNIFNVLELELAKNTETARYLVSTESFDIHYNNVLTAMEFSNAPSFYQNYIKLYFVSKLFTYLENHVDPLAQKQALFEKYFYDFDFKKEKQLFEPTYLMFYDHLRDKIQQQVVFHGLYEANSTSYIDLFYEISERQVKEFKSLTLKKQFFSVDELYLLSCNIELLYSYINHADIWPLQFFSKKAFYSTCGQLLVSAELIDDSIKTQWFCVIDQTVEGLLQCNEYELLMRLMDKTLKVANMPHSFLMGNKKEYDFFLPFLREALQEELLTMVEETEIHIESIPLESQFKAFSLNIFFESCALDLPGNEINPSKQLVKLMHVSYKEALDELIVFLSNFIEYKELTHSYIDSHPIKIKKTGAKLLKKLSEIFSDPDLEGQRILKVNLIDSLKMGMNFVSGKKLIQKDYLAICDLYKYSMPILNLMGLSKENEKSLINHFKEFEIKIKKLSLPEKSLDELMKEIEGTSEPTLTLSTKSGGAPKQKKKGKSKEKLKEGKKKAAITALAVNESELVSDKGGKETAPFMSNRSSTSMMMKSITAVTVSEAEKFEDELKGEFIPVRNQGKKIGKKAPVIKQAAKIETTLVIQLKSTIKIKKYTGTNEVISSKAACRAELGEQDRKENIGEFSTVVSLGGHLKVNAADEAQIGVLPVVQTKSTISIKTKAACSEQGLRADEIKFYEAIFEGDTPKVSSASPFSLSADAAIFTQVSNFKPAPLIEKSTLPQGLIQLSENIEKIFGEPLILTGKAVSALYTGYGTINDYDCLVCNIELEPLINKILEWGFHCESRGKIHKILYASFTEAGTKVEVDISVLCFDSSKTRHEALEEDARKRDLFSTALHLPLDSNNNTCYVVYDYLKALPYVEKRIVEINPFLDEKILTSSTKNIFSADPIRLIRLLKELIEQRPYMRGYGPRLISYYSRLSASEFQHEFWSEYFFDTPFEKRKQNRSHFQTKFASIFFRYDLEEIYPIFSTFNIVEGLSGLDKSLVNASFELSINSYKGDKKTQLIIFYLSVLTTLYTSTMVEQASNIFLNVIYQVPYSDEIEAIKNCCINDLPIHEEVTPLAFRVHNNSKCLTHKQGEAHVSPKF